MDGYRRGGRVFAWLLRLTLLAMAAGFAIRGNGILVASSILAFAVSLVPRILESEGVATTPWPLEVLIVALLVLHMWGLYTNAYRWVPFYDKILHGTTSALLALLATLLVYTVDRYVQGIRIVGYRGLAVLVFLFTLGLGALWETGEFTSDIFLGTHNQAGNLDTMLDLVSDGIAGAIAAALSTWAASRGFLDEMAAEVAGRAHRTEPAGAESRTSPDDERLEAKADR